MTSVKCFLTLTGMGRKRKAKRAGGVVTGGLSPSAEKPPVYVALVKRNKGGMEEPQERFLKAVGKWLETKRTLLEARSHGAETTVLPTEGPMARIGAAMYFAVLAYPKKKEWGMRDSFLEAVCHWLDKDYLGSWSERKTEEMVRSCFRRIVTKRMEAGLHAFRIVFFEQWTVGALRPYWRGKIPKVTIGNLHPRLVGPKPKDVDWKKWYSSSGRGNIMHRTWAESLPVLHLMIALLRNSPTGPLDELHPRDRGQRTEPARDLDRMLISPSWLSKALLESEYWRLKLHEYVKTFDPTTAVRLIPSPAHPTPRKSAS